MIFQKSKIKNPQAGMKDKAAMCIAKWLLNIQVSFAKKMNTVAGNIPLKKMKMIVVLFFMVNGSLSVYIAISSLFNDKKNMVKIEQVKIPVFDGEKTNSDQFACDDTFRSIKSIQTYLDSLTQTAAGQHVYDSIVSERPGLIDSLKMLKEIYKSQNKK